MPLTIPPELKAITPYIRRAEELDKDQVTPDAREVAYFCRSYAMEKAMKLRGGASNPAVDNFLMALMSELEQTKRALPPGTNERAKMMCENFALAVFEKADEEDRAGMANKETARVFYNASSFFDILEQFGDLDEEFAAKNKYAKWKATEIMKALKEGRTPEPGGFGEVVSSAPPDIPNPPANQPAPQSPADIGVPFPSGVPNHHPTDVVSINSIPQAPPVYSQPPIYGNYDPTQQYRGLQSPPTYPPQYAPPQQQNLAGYNQPPPQPIYSGNANVPYKKPPTLTLDERTKDALELCAFAMAALKHKETELAKDRLREALKRLG